MSRIAELKKELAELEAEEKKRRIEAIGLVIDTLVRDMSYEQMCEVREVLNERIRNKYASDAIDDE